MPQPDVQPTTLADSVESHEYTRPDHQSGTARRRHEAADDEATPRRIGRYSVVRELARGGFGRVYEAVDPDLERSVALKVLQRAEATVLARFVREARLTATLQHPAIVPVHDVGTTDEGRPYYAMRQIPGLTLAQAIDAADDLSSRLKLLAPMLTVAEAIAFAHSEGVVHRDIKPQNIVLGRFGETYVVDWGLAKRLGQDEAQVLPIGERTIASGTLTVAGAVMGTPAYMAPEQARGEVASKPADVYALGAVLQQLLTGRVPKTADAGSTTQPPAAVSLAGAPIELLAIVEQAMQPDADDRYPDAEAMAADLRSFTTGQLVGAHDYTTWQLVKRWSRKHRGYLMLATAALLALAAISAASVRNVIQARDDAQAAQSVAEDMRATANRQRVDLMRSYIDAAVEQDPTRALAWLKLYVRETGDAHGGHVLAESARSRGVAQHVWRAHGDQPVTALAASPDGRWLASGATDGSLRLYDLDNATSLALEGHRQRVIELAFRSDSSELISLGRDWTVVRWSRVDRHANGAWKPTRQHFPRLASMPGLTSHLAIDSDAGTIAVALLPHGVGVLDTVAGSYRELPSNGTELVRLAISENGSNLVGGGSDGSVLQWDLVSGTSRELGRHNAAVHWVTISRDSRRIASGDARGHIGLWDDVRTSAREIDAHPGAIWTLAFSPDSAELVSVGGHEVRRWSATGEPLGLLDRLRATAGTRAHFSPDGHYAVFNTWDGAAWLYDRRSGASRTLIGHGAGINRSRFVPGREWLATAADDGSVRLWPLRTNRRRLGHSDEVTLGFMLADHNTAFSQHVGGIVRAWDLASGKTSTLSLRFPRRNPGVQFYAGSAYLADVDGYVHGWAPNSSASRPMHDKPLCRGCAYAVASDGTLALMHDPRRITLRDIATAQERSLPSATAALRALHFNADATSLFAVNEHGSLEVWDIERNSHHVARRGTGGGRLAVSRNGNRAVIAQRDGQLWAHDFASNKSERLFGTLDFTPLPSFDPSGRWLSAGFFDSSVRVWDFETHTERILRGHRGGVRRARVHAGSRLVASASQDQSLRLWDLHSGTGAPLHGHEAAVLDARFLPPRQPPPNAAPVEASPAPPRLLSADAQGGFELWELSAPDDPEALLRWLERMTTAVVDDDGQQLQSPLRAAASAVGP